MDKPLYKVAQKRAYDLLSHRYGFIFILIGIILLLTGAFHFGESVKEWSTEKYAVVFNSYSDNLAGRSYRQRLCLPVPIDVVYTWVNGSDPALLHQLNLVKHDMETELNVTRIMSPVKDGEEKCLFTECVPMTMVVMDSVLPANMTLQQLSNVHQQFASATRIYTITSPVNKHLNFTVVVFEDDNAVKAALAEPLIINGRNTTMKRAYITSEWTIQHSILMSDTAIMAGFPDTLSSGQLKDKLPTKYQDILLKVEIHSEQGLAALHMRDKDSLKLILQDTNITIDGKEPTLHAANLVWDLSETGPSEDMAANRFADNEELRYSLRSIEQFAPWVRHVFIVTNGQIPHWLDLENPRVTLITHEELFVNKSHLPTFSSSAIETHLHRIPGLSDKFIYLNDDVMFGKEVWPDDFYTHSDGQKVYLTWPVPSCRDGCPATWILDGYCDKACNNSECEWDGGDCKGGKGPGFNNAGAAGWAGQVDMESIYCHSGCANNWIADRYCDQSCNVPECGYDAGDCGDGNFHKMTFVDLSMSKHHYTVPTGENIVVFNLTELFGPTGIVEEASYEKSEVIRAGGVALKFKVMTMVLFPGHNKTILNFNLQGNNSKDEQIKFNFTVSVETTIVPKTNTVDMNKTTDIALKYNDTLLEKKIPFIFKEISVDLRYPHTVFHKEAEAVENFDDWKDLQLPDQLRKDLEDLETQFIADELTLRGYKMRRNILISSGVKNGHIDLSLKRNTTPNHNGSMIQSNKDGILNMLNASMIKDTYAKKQNVSSIKDQINQDNYGRKVRDVNENQVNKEGEDNDQHARVGRKLSWLDQGAFVPGVFRWERSGPLRELQRMKEERMRSNEYNSQAVNGRRLLDTFSETLRHMNKIYNKAFGYNARKVPGHIPHMVDKNIMSDLQEMFPEEWDATSNHRVRTSTDMQFSFAYFYYLMGVKKNTTMEDVFDRMDTDNSRVLSDRELRTLAAQINELPLTLENLNNLEMILVNCSESLPEQLTREVPPPEVETYYEKNMVQATRNLFIHCEQMQEVIIKKFPAQHKYKFTILGEEEIWFKMIKSNVSEEVGQLDNIRKHPRKFICLNDNIEHDQEAAKTIKAILHDFYESLLPIPSQFELARDYRNRFLHVDELRNWRWFRDWLRFWTYIAMALLIIFTISSYFGDKIEAAKLRYQRGRRKTPASESRASDKPLLPV